MINLLAVNLTSDFGRLNTCQAVFDNEYDYGRCYVGVAFVNYTCSLSVEFEQHSWYGTILVHCILLKVIKYMTERLLMGHKELNQTNKQKINPYCGKFCQRGPNFDHVFFSC